MSFIIFFKDKAIAAHTNIRRDHYRREETRRARDDGGLFIFRFCFIIISRATYTTRVTAEPSSNPPPPTCPPGDTRNALRVSTRQKTINYRYFIGYFPDENLVSRRTRKRRDVLWLQRHRICMRLRIVVFFFFVHSPRSVCRDVPESVVVARSPDDIRELLSVGIGRQFFAYINMRIDIAAGFQRRTRDVFQYDLLVGGRGAALDSLVRYHKQKYNL